MKKKSVMLLHRSKDTLDALARYLEDEFEVLSYQNAETALQSKLLADVDVYIVGTKLGGLWGEIAVSPQISIGDHNDYSGIEFALFIRSKGHMSPIIFFGMDIDTVRNYMEQYPHYDSKIFYVSTQERDSSDLLMEQLSTL